jgi:hypothetical protein
MNQTQFNQLINLYVKEKAAKKNLETFRHEGEIILQEISSLNKIKTELTRQLEEKKKELVAMDNEINSLYAQLPSKEVDELENARASDEIEIILIRKSLLLCEISIIENKLSIIKNEHDNLFNQPNHLYYVSAFSQWKKAESKLMETLKKAMIITHPKLSKETICDAVLKNELFSDFSQHINHLCNSHFVYTIPHASLIEKLAMIINSSYWQDQTRCEETQFFIRKMQNILHEVDEIGAENSFNKLQKLAKTITTPSFFKRQTNNKEILNLCDAILTTDLIFLEEFLQKIDLLQEKIITENRMLIKNIKPTLVESRNNFSKNDNQATELMNIFIVMQAVRLVAKETTETIERVINEFQELNAEIASIEEMKSKIEEQIGVLNISLADTRKNYVENKKKYPDLRDDLYTINKKDSTQINGEIWFHTINNEKLKTALDEKKKQYNVKLIENNSIIFQCVTMSQFTIHLHRQFIQQCSILMERDELALNRSTIEFLANKIADSSDENAHVGINIKHLNSILKTSESYTLSYQFFIQKIVDLINHDHWKSIKQQGGNIKGIQEMATFLTKQPITDKKCFDSLQKIAKKQLENEVGFWGEKLHQDIKVFYDALINVNLFQLEKLSIKFNFLPKNESIKKLNI